LSTRQRAEFANWAKTRKSPLRSGWQRNYQRRDVATRLAAASRLTHEFWKASPPTICARFPNAIIAIPWHHSRPRSSLYRKVERIDVEMLQILSRKASFR